MLYRAARCCNVSVSFTFAITRHRTDQMKPKAQSLFHFTKELAVLRSILLEGFWPRYSLEDFRWQVTAPGDHEFAAFPMVCFCDIPLSRIDEHVDFYGAYGIGLSKEWGVQAGLNPVQYIAGPNSVTAALVLLADISRKHTDDNAAAAAFLLHHVASFMKPIKGQMRVRGSLEDKDFYQESEWRFVPNGADLPQFLRHAQFDDTALLEDLHQKSKAQAMLRFSPSDIKYIFVRLDEEIPAMIDFIQNELVAYSESERKVLMSRVTSIETTKGDW